LIFECLIKGPYKALFLLFRINPHTGLVMSLHNRPISVYYHNSTKIIYYFPENTNFDLFSDFSTLINLLIKFSAKRDLLKRKSPHLNQYNKYFSRISLNSSKPVCHAAFISSILFPASISARIEPLPTRLSKKEIPAVLGVLN
jgi:hypothetical protein